MARPRLGGRGFTLVEVMIVVAIIMVLAVAGMPNIMGATKEKPLVDATDRVMGAFSFAKHRAVNNFAAYGVVVAPAVSNEQPGSLAIFQGAGPQCGDVDVSGTPIKVVDLADLFDYADTNSGTMVAVRVIQVDPAATLFVCFTPDGRMLDGATSQPISPPVGANSTYGAGDLTIVLQRYEGELPASLKHNVIVPFSGKPRWTFGEDLQGGEGEGGA